MGSSAASSIEREIKFGARIGQDLPDLRPVVGRTLRQPRQRLHTRYFDTIDGRLLDRGLTLRHRTTDAGDFGLWTLKLPSANSGDALVRTELTWSGPSVAIPEDALRILQGLIRREPLRPLVELATERQRLLLQGPDAEVLAELDDDIVKVVGGPRDGLRFRQIELELREGGEWCSKPVKASLKSAGLRVESVQKLAKALGRRPGSTRRSSLDSSSTLDDLLRSSLRDGYERLVEHDWHLRADLKHPPRHAVHQARVASRRLRSNLKTFGSVLDPVWLRLVRSDLRWVGTSLGEVRDADVLDNHLEGLPDELGRLLDEQRSVASQRLSSVLTSDRYLDLLDRLQAGSEVLPLRDDRSVAQAHDAAHATVLALVDAEWRSLRKQARRAKLDADPEQLHKTRIKAKRLRYAGEAVAPIIGKPARRLAAAAERVQGDLGEHHDAVVAQEWLRRQITTPTSEAGLPTPVAAFDAGVLAATQRARQREFEKRWQRSWKRVTAARRHWPAHHPSM
jgi:CHAD domain-containing protein